MTNTLIHNPEDFMSEVLDFLEDHWEDNQGTLLLCETLCEGYSKETWEDLYKTNESLITLEQTTNLSGDRLEDLFCESLDKKGVPYWLWSYHSSYQEDQPGSVKEN